jgi:hypothetical protein
MMLVTNFVAQLEKEKKKGRARLFRDGLKHVSLSKLRKIQRSMFDVLSSIQKWRR